MILGFGLAGAGGAAVDLALKCAQLASESRPYRDSSDLPFTRGLTDESLTGRLVAHTGFEPGRGTAITCAFRELARFRYSQIAVSSTQKQNITGPFDRGFDSAE